MQPFATLEVTTAPRLLLYPHSFRTGRRCTIATENETLSHYLYRTSKRSNPRFSPPSHQGNEYVVDNVHCEVQRDVQRPTRPAIIRVFALHDGVVSQVAHPAVPQVPGEFLGGYSRVARKRRRYRQRYTDQKLEDGHPAEHTEMTKRAGWLGKEEGRENHELL